MLPILTLLFSGCFNADMNFRSTATATLTSPVSSTYINHLNETSFPISGTCTKSGASVSIAVESYPALTTTTSCSNGAWSTTLNLSSIPYDDTVTLDISISDNGLSGSVSNATFYKRQCSASDYLSGSNYPYGNGTSIPYIICTTSQLQRLMSTTTDWSLSFYLMNDLDFTSLTPTPIGTSGTPFTGSFDGKNHTVSNLTYSTAILYSGFFGYTGAAVSIKNLTLTSISITNSMAASYTGGIVAFSTGGVIDRVTVNGSIIVSTVSAGGAGGIAGNVNTTSVSNVNATISISLATGAASNYVGGIVGYMQSGNLTGCNASVNLTNGSGTGNSMGGIVGTLLGGNVSNCISSGGISTSGTSSYTGGAIANVTGGGVLSALRSSVSISPSAGSSFAGGLFGQISVTTGSITITNSSASGSITLGSAGGNYAGGFVGKLQTSGASTASISNSSASGSISSTSNSIVDSIGGFSGNFNNTTGTQSISNSYATGNISGSSPSYIAGFVAQISASAVISISNCYSVGAVTGTAIAGGFSANATGSPSLSYCFYDQASSTQGSANVPAVSASTINNLPTASMQAQSTYSSVGWDFTNTWRISSSTNGGYPTLAWQ